MTGLDYEHDAFWRFEPPYGEHIGCYRVRPACLSDREAFRAVVRKFKDSLPEGDSITILSVNEVNYWKNGDLEALLDDMPKRVNLIHVQSTTAVLRLAWYETRVSTWNNSESGYFIREICSVVESHSRVNRLARLNGRFNVPRKMRPRVMRWRSREQIERRSLALMSGGFGFAGGIVAIILREIISRP